LTDLPEINPDDEVEVQEIGHAPPLTDRSVSRRIALQVLYELDCTTHRPGEVLESRINAQELDGRGARYVRLLVTGVLDNKPALDTAIRRYAVEFPLEQVAIVDRNILRIALYEFAIAQTVTVGTAIDEAVGLADVFGADSTPSFVNGVLGKMALDIDKLRTELIKSGEEREV
jgi:N utilization substance protein B